MLATNVIIDNSISQSTFHITYAGSFGTCFQYIYTRGKIGNAFLVTVRHLFNGVAEGSEIEVAIKTETGSKNVKGMIYFHKDPKIDVAVIMIDETLCDYYVFEEERYTVGQDLYFCGFPYGFTMDSVGINNGYPFPIVKKAMISAFNGPKKILTLDGHNNPGFSGSPLGYFNMDTRKAHLAGVVFGYQPQANTMTVGAISLPYQENSGIFYAHTFESVLETIRDLEAKGLLDQKR